MLVAYMELQPGDKRDDSLQSVPIYRIYGSKVLATHMNVTDTITRLTISLVEKTRDEHQPARNVPSVVHVHFVLL